MYKNIFKLNSFLPKTNSFQVTLRSNANGNQLDSIKIPSFLRMNSLRKNISKTIANKKSRYLQYCESKQCHDPCNPPNITLNAFEKKILNPYCVIRNKIVIPLCCPYDSNPILGFIQEFVRIHRIAKCEREEYRRYIQSLDGNCDIKPYNDEICMKLLEKFENLK